MDIQDTFEKYRDIILQYAAPAVYAILTLIIGWWIIVRVTKIFKRKILSHNIDESLKQFLSTLVGVSLKVLLIITVIDMVGIKTTSFMAILGSAGLAVGLALSGTLQNFASGVLILFQRPFKVGDYIEAQGYEGTVKAIEIFRTTLLTIDYKTVIIPNSQLANASMVNYTAEPTRLVEFVFGISYDDDIQKARQVLLDSIFTDPKVLNQATPFVNVCEHADSSVNIKVRAEVKTEDYWEIYFTKMEQVKVAFDKNQITIPFPQRDIHQK